MTAPTQQRAPLHRILRAKLAEANRKADQAIDDYNEAKAARMREAGTDAGRRFTGTRDAVELTELGNKVNFHTQRALRLAATLQCELLAALLDAAERQRP